MKIDVTLDWKGLLTTLVAKALWLCNRFSDSSTACKPFNPAGALLLLRQVGITWKVYIYRIRLTCKTYIGFFKFILLGIVFTRTTPSSVDKLRCACPSFINDLLDLQCDALFFNCSYLDYNVHTLSDNFLEKDNMKVCALMQNNFCKILPVISSQQACILQKKITVLL